MDIKRCEICKTPYDIGELFGGFICQDCLKLHLNPERFFKFATSDTLSGDTADRLEEFFFTKVFRIEAPRSGSPELRAYLKDLYKRLVAEDMLLEQTAFTRRIHEYVFGNFANAEAYAEWLHNYRSSLFEHLGRKETLGRYDY